MHEYIKKTSLYALAFSEIGILFSNQMKRVLQTACDKNKD